MRFGFVQILLLLLLLVFPLTAAVIYVIYLLIQALRKYTKSEPVRRAKAEDAKTLGEVLKKRRMDCKMTQRRVRSQHHESDGAGQAVRHDGRRAFEGNKVK